MTLPDFVNVENASYAVAGLTVVSSALTAIAPLTKNKFDDKLLAAVLWFRDKVDLVGLVSRAVGKKAATKVRDHR